MIGNTGRIWRLALKTGYNVQDVCVPVDDVCDFWYTEGYLELDKMDAYGRLVWRVI